MDNFKTIYRILKTLEKAMDMEKFDKTNISKEALEITGARWCRIMAMLVYEGYITGVSVWNPMDQSYPRVAIGRIEITLKGLEYLNDNSLMKKAANLAKGISDIMP